LGRGVARLAIEKFSLTRADVLHLKQIAGIQDTISSSFYARFGLKGLFSIAIATAALLAAQVPKEIFDEWLSKWLWDSAYPMYRVLLLALLLVGLLAMLLVWLIARPYASRRSSDTRLFNAVLVYLDLPYPGERTHSRNRSDEDEARDHRVTGRRSHRHFESARTEDRGPSCSHRRRDLHERHPRRVPLRVSALSRSRRPEALLARTPGRPIPRT
jgi:hypothetical protein